VVELQWQCRGVYGRGRVVLTNGKFHASGRIVTAEESFRAQWRCRRKVVRGWARRRCIIQRKLYGSGTKGRISFFFAARCRLYIFNMYTSCTHSSRRTFFALSWPQLVLLLRLVVLPAMLLFRFPCNNKPLISCIVSFHNSRCYINPNLSMQTVTRSRKQLHAPTLYIRFIGWSFYVLRKKN